MSGALEQIADHRVMLPLAAVLAGWRDGDEHGWQVEFDRLRSDRQGYIDMLATSVQETGIRLPILLGSDGRVWDGHHRLCVADMLALETVPCEFADRDAVALPGLVKDLRSMAGMEFDKRGPMDARGAAIWDVAAWLEKRSEATSADLRASGVGSAPGAVRDDESASVARDGNQP